MANACAVRNEERFCRQGGCRLLFLPSDEENDEDFESLYYLPAAPEIDDPEETGWGNEVTAAFL